MSKGFVFLAYFTCVLLSFQADVQLQQYVSIKIFRLTPFSEILICTYSVNAVCMTEDHVVKMENNILGLIS